MLRFAEKYDIERVMDIQAAAYDQMNPEWLSTVNRASYIEEIEHQHMVVAVEDNQVVAFRMVVVPEEDYLGQALNDYRRVIYYDITVVHPDYRGRGYQTKMGQFLYDEVIKPQSFDWVLCTVHPDNTASMVDKFKLGMAVVYLGEMYGGKERFILMREDSMNWADDTVIVPLVERQRIAELLTAGYFGRQLIDDELLFDRLI